MLKFGRKKEATDEPAWKITIYEIFKSRGGSRIMSSFTVKVLPSTSVDKFIKKCRSSPGNHEKDATTAANLYPHDPSTIGTIDHDNDHQLRSENPDGKPNCTWTPEPKKTIQEAGLCDGAELSFYTRRRKD